MNISRAGYWPKSLKTGQYPGPSKRQETPGHVGRYRSIRIGKAAGLCAHQMRNRTEEIMLGLSWPPWSLLRCWQLWGSPGAY